MSLFECITCSCPLALAVELTQRLQTTNGSFRSSVLATPDRMFLGIKGYYASTREVATINVPSAGSDRGSEHAFTPVAWNNGNVPASCSTFRRTVRQEMEKRFVVLPS